LQLQGIAYIPVIPNSKRYPLPCTKHKHQRRHRPDADDISRKPEPGNTIPEPADGNHQPQPQARNATTSRRMYNTSDKIPTVSNKLNRQPYSANQSAYQKKSETRNQIISRQNI